MQNKRTKNLADALAASALFEGLPPEQVDAVRQIAVTRAYAKGETLFSEGDDGIGFYVMITGQIKVFKLSAEGKEQILHIFGPGEPVGEVPVFSGKPYPASAEALAASRAAFFPKADFVRLIAENPTLALNMLAVLSRRLRQFTVQVENLSLKEVPARLASYLLLLSGKEKRETVTLPISKSQLASLIGTIPETLSRILTRMAAADLILGDRRQIKLLDPEGLETLAMSGKFEGL
ncbi:MAG: Crp/Fnr family transcriptional regulator [Pseudomonadota bacterium]